MTRRGPWAAAVALAALLPLAACGVRGTDVVEAGGAATVVVGPIPETRMLLYFVGPDGRPMPVAREVGYSSPDPTSESGDPESGRTPYDGFGPGYEIDEKDLHRSRVVTVKVLAALLAGPNEAEAAAGLATALPRGTESPHVQEEKAGGTDGRRLLRVRAPFSVTDLPEAAVHQLVCTTAYAEDRAGRAQIALTGPDGTLPPAVCDD